MTKKDEKNENSANHAADIDANNEKSSAASAESQKTNKVAEKLKAMGVMSSGKEKPVAEGRKISPLLITLLIAVPVVGAIAYVNMPGPFNQLASSVSNVFSTAPDQPAPASGYDQSAMTASSAEDPWRRTDTLAMNQSRYQEPEWVIQRRADMEKRRLEFEQQNADRYSANQSASQPPEPPQWVQDRQAQMEQERARYQQQRPMYQQPAGRSYNGAPPSPAYMQHPGSYPNQLNNNTAQLPVPQNQPPANVNPQYQRQYYNGRPHQVNRPYYNGPSYGYGPNYAPYGWNAYPNR